jgi:NitT/TauT family transport system substrate-binding protein
MVPLMKKWAGLLIVAVICVVVALTAYLALQLSTPSSTPVTAKVRVGCQPSWHHAALFIILEKGWVQKALGVELDVRVFATGPEEMEAFAAGALDVAYVGATPPLSIIAKGARAKIVAVANTEGSSIVVRPDLMYEGPQSLIGKTIGCYPPGSIQHTLLTRWLRGNGVDPDREVTMRFQGPAEQLESLRAKAIDAALVPDPHPYVAVVRGYGKMAVNSSEMWPHHPCCVVLMSEDFITRNREVAVRLVALHVIASEYATRPENREEVVSILVKHLGIERKVAEAFPGTTSLETDPRNSEWLSGLDLMCQVHYDLGLTKDPEGRVVRLKASEIVNASLYEEALKLTPRIKAELGLR